MAQKISLYTGFVRVLENLESPGISLWHFPGLESPGKRPLVLESPGNLWNAAKNMKCMEGSKENCHWDLGIVEVNVNFRALEKSIWVLEKSWKSPGNLFVKKGTNPVYNLENYHLSISKVILFFLSSQRVNILKSLIHLRCQRMLLVANFGQYRFVYTTLIHFLKNSRLIWKYKAKCH